MLQLVSLLVLVVVVPYMKLQIMGGLMLCVY